MIIAEGYAYDNATRGWTQRVEYIARTECEARNWIKFQQDWLDKLRIVRRDVAPL